MFMSNFTRSGGRAKIWQSITNLSCCSIDLMTKQSKSVRALAFIMLFMFSTGSIYAQDLERSTFFNRCLADAPPGPTEADVANLYANQCGENAIEVIKTPLIEGNDCAWNVEYTYDVKCGDFEEQIKISYNGGDLDAPTLNDGAELPTGGSSLNLCYTDIPAGPSIQDITDLYSDNCSDVIVTKSGTPEGDNCHWTVTYKYTIQDACGNFAPDLDIIYSGGDTEPPSLTKDAELPIGQTGLNLCFEDKVEGPTVEDITALYEDNCSGVTVTKEEFSKGSDCKWMAQYTYTIKDDCNNFAESFVITYSGGDSEAPELDGVPGDITVDCIDLIPEPDDKNVSATDNCADDLQIIVSDDTSQLGDACTGGVLIRTYSVSDNCGYSDSQTQTITVLPAPAAEFEEVEDMTITCEEANAFAPGSLSYTNGGSGACEISGSVQGVLSGSYDECGGTLEVDWTYTDDCERTIDAKKVITVLPAPAAEFDGTQDMTITCEEANAFQASSLSYSNGGTGVCEISGSVDGQATPSYDECGGSIAVSWTYTDNCERTITANQTITVLPAPAAEFEAVEDMTITCEEANAFAPGTLSYTNGGTGACEISGSVQGVLSGSYDECGGTLEVDWTYTDNCERTIDAKKVITVLPAPAAEFEEVEDMTITCEEANAFAPGTLSYTNGGTGACEISGSVQGVLSGTYDECGGTLEVDWTYTDDCERTIDAKKVITVLPAPAAEFEAVEDMTITCEEANVFQAGSLSYTNGGTGVCEISGSVQGVLSGSYDECGGTLEVDWTYTDDCERTIDAKKVITVLPAPMAQFESIENITITCEEANDFEAGSLSYTNGGTGICEISGSVQGVLSGEFDYCGGLLFIDWTYTDDCERTITERQQIKVNPAPAAEFEAVEDMTITCEEANVFQAGSLSYTNGGSGACEISGSVQGVLSGSYDECGGTLEVDWTYTDDCERTIDAKKVITVLPAPAAEFDGTQDMTITCEEANAFQASSLSYSNGGTGVCEISGSVDGQATPSYDECGGSIAVSWTYTDNCERTITANQTITVLPAPAAEFEAVEDMTITCEEANAFAPGTLSYTNGGTGACEISGSVQGVLSGSYDECGGTLEVDWTYTDNCERTIDAKKVITVLPAPAAEFEEVEDMTITCEEANAFAPGTLSYTNGGTGACEISGSVQGVLSGSYDECGGTLEVDWTYTDDCERTIDAKKVITVLPAPAAEFEAVEDMTITCEEANVFQAGSLSYTNGGTGVCEISGSVQGQATPSYDECGGSILVSWTYTDDCERTITANKTVTVLPAPAAEFEAVLDMTITCEEANVFAPGSLSYTNGGTGACEISGSVQGVLSGSYDECGGTLEVDWTYTDDCERTIDAKKVITVLPAPAAEFEAVEDMTITCEEANVFQAGSLSYTNGGSGACEISGSVQGVLSGTYDECGGTLEVDWTYTDDCERTIDAKKVITVLPAPAAEFDPVEDIQITCEAANQYQASPLGYSNGGTGACEISGSVDGQATPDYDECGGFIYVDLDLHR